MVARAFSETSGKTCSRTSARAGDDAGTLGALAAGNVSVRAEAGVGVATGELCGCATGFFSAAACREFCVAAGEDGFGADAVWRRAGCSTRFGCAAGGAEACEADDEESERWPRIFGSAMMATIIRSTAAAGTREVGRTRACFRGVAGVSQGTDRWLASS